jgi:hypothetical protein
MPKDNLGGKAREAAMVWCPGFGVRVEREKYQMESP